MMAPRVHPLNRLYHNITRPPPGKARKDPFFSLPWVGERKIFLTVLGWTTKLKEDG